MRLETSTTRSLRFGRVTIAALAFSIGLALGNISPARADGDEAAQNGAIDSDQDAQAGPTPPSRRTMRRTRHKKLSTQRRSSAISSRATARRRIRLMRPIRRLHRRGSPRMPTTKQRKGRMKHNERSASDRRNSIIG